jgi:hypothetical protein
MQIRILPSQPPCRSREDLRARGLQALVASAASALHCGQADPRNYPDQRRQRPRLKLERVVRHSFSTVVLSVFGVLVAGLAAQGQDGARRLDSRIGPARPAEYQRVFEPEGWKNPSVLIEADRLTLFTQGVPQGRVVTTEAELVAALIHLPVSAWPYGRVVAATEQGIVPIPDTGREGRARNRRRLASALRRLRVQVEWWPA